MRMLKMKTSLTHSVARNVPSKTKVNAYASPSAHAIAAVVDSVHEDINADVIVGAHTTIQI